MFEGLENPNLGSYSSCLEEIGNVIDANLSYFSKLKNRKDKKFVGKLKSFINNKAFLPILRAVYSAMDWN